MEHRHPRLPARLHRRRERDHALADDVEDAREVVLDGELEGGDRVDLVDELEERIEAHQAHHGALREVARDVVVHRGPDDRRRAKDGDHRALRLLGEGRDLALGRDLVAEEGLVRHGAERVLLGEEVRVRRVRAVEDRLAPEDELGERVRRAPFKEVHRPDRLELRGPRPSRASATEEREVDEDVDLLALEGSRRRDLRSPRR